MRKDLLSILACPVCKGPLRLETDHQDSEGIMRGALHCAPCAAVYRIREGIPHLLPAPNRVS